MVNYRRKLTFKEIIDAFPEECKTLPRIKIKEILKELEPYRQVAINIKTHGYPLEWQNFGLMVLQEIYMPKHKITQLQKLRALEQVMRNEKDLIDYDDIQEAKNISIEVLYPNWKKFKRTARGFTACCPFHEDEHPSFSVRDNHYICFTCLEKGDSIEFIRKLERLNFSQSIRRLNGKN